jgi:hypothetical protein
MLQVRHRLIITHKTLKKKPMFVDNRKKEEEICIECPEA